MDMRGQHGNRDGQMDEYGNPIQQTDVYEKSLPTREAGYGTTGAGYGTTTEAGGEQPQMTHSEKEHHGGGMLHRSGSSGSSSSEDDGMGGRRKKKGMKEKIKEKLPGGRKTDEHGQQGHGHGPATIGTGHEGIITTTGATGHHDPEKKGFVEKIKEKMPDGDKIVEHEQQGGGDGHGQATMGTSTGYGGTTMTTGATGHHDLEKKGLMEKIKKKLPGGDKTDEHGQQGYGHGQATTGTGHRESTTTTGAAGHHDPEKKGFMENIKEKLPGGDKTVEHEQQGYEHGQATMATGTGYGETTTTTGAIGHHDPEKKDFVQKIKEKLPGEDKTDEHGQQRYGHGQATTGTGTGYGETTTTTGAIGHHDPEKKGFMEIKEKLPGGDKTDEHGQQGYGHGQATMGTGHKESATTTGAVGHHDPEKNGFMEKIKEKQPGGDKTVEHEQQGYGHEKATTGTSPGYGETTTTTGAIGHHDPEKKGFVKKIKEKLSGEDKTDEHGQQGYGHEQATTGTGNKETTTMTGTTMTGAAGHHDPEKKGFMKKIMEKLPGHN